MRKKEFTSSDVLAVVHELKNTVLNSRVNNVYQLDTKTLILKLHKMDKAPIRLVLEAGRRLHLTLYVSEKPSVPPAFCMALRKYLRGGWLVNVEQHEFERIVTFSFKTKWGVLQLVLELFGDGNIILVNEKGRILQALIYKRMRDRDILRDEVFQFPPSSGKNPFRISKDELADALKGFGEVEVVKVLARFLSIGGFYAEEILLRANVEKTKHCNTLTVSEVDAVFDALQSLLSPVSGFKLEPLIVLDEKGGFVDVVPFRLKRYEGFRNQSYGSFNEALDEFYVRVTAVEKATVGIEVEELEREAERLRRIIAEQEKVLTEAESKAERDRLIGDTIYANMSALQALLDKFLTAKKNGKEWNIIVSEVLAAKKAGSGPEAFFESFDPRTLIVNVYVNDLRFGLSLRKTLFENAAEFYERSKRSKQKLAGAEVALEETRKKLSENEAKIREAEALERTRPAEVMEELAKHKVKSKEWFQKFRWFISSDGFLVVAGKDAVSNEVLIKKYAEPDDVVFHADITGAPFVVVKTEGKQPSEQCLQEAATFAVALSRGWREGFGAADVYWVKPEQLSKAGPSGEYVPRGAFVVSGKRDWMRSVPLKLAIGAVEKENGEIEFVGGPVEAVRAKTKNYVTIGPGDIKGKELLKQILRTLTSKMPKEQRQKIQKTSIEEIAGFIPYTKGRILENRNL